MLELIETYRAKNLMGVPTMLVAILEHPDFKRRDLSSISVIGSGASTVPTALVQRLERELDAPFVIAFGQTECSPTATNTLPGDSIEDKANTVGPPMPHTEAKIVDPETGDTVPVGTLGEFCTRGYHVMLEYFDMPESTQQTIDADGWLHTGDLCTMDARGYCSVEGRLKDMIIRGGENIYPREIEEALFRHPSVGEVAVVGLPDARWGEEIGAFLRPAPGARCPVGPGGPVRLPAAGAIRAEDPAAVVRGGGLSADRLGQDPEVQAAGAVAGGAVPAAGLTGTGRPAWGHPLGATRLGRPA